MQAEAKQPTEIGFFVFYCPEKAPNVPNRTWLFASNLPRAIAEFQLSHYDLQGVASTVRIIKSQSGADCKH